MVGDKDPKTMKKHKQSQHYREERSINGMKNKKITHILYAEKFEEHMKKIEGGNSGLIKMSHKYKVRNVQRNGKRDKIRSLSNFEVKHDEIN